MRKLAFYGAVLIGTYLVVNNSTNSGHLFGTVTSGSSNVIKALQGR